MHFPAANTALVIQIIRSHYPDDGTYIRHRWNGWTSWHKIEVDIPAFYKSYSDLSSLSTALGVMSCRRTTITSGEADFNTFMDYGRIYQVMAGSLTIKNGWDGAFVSTLVFYLGVSNGVGIQIAMAYNGNYIYMRAYWSGFSGWVKLV